MKYTLIILLTAWSISLFWGVKLSFAEQLPLGPRENAILSTFNQLQKKEKPQDETRVIFRARQNAIFTALNNMEAREYAISKDMKEAKGRLLSLLISNSRKKKKETLGQQYLSSHTHPYLTFQNTLTNLIYSNRKAGKTDLTYNIVTGFKTELPRRRNSLNLDMHIDSLYCQRTPDDNAQALTISPLYSANLGRYTIAFSDDVFTNRISTPQLGIKIDKLVFYWDNLFKTTLGRDFNRTGFDIGYSRDDLVKEKDDNTGTKTTETFSLNHYLKIATKTKASLSYARARTLYPRKDTSNSGSNDFNLNLSGVLSPKVTGSANMDCNLTENKTSDDTRDTSYSTKLAWNINRQSNLALELRHDIHDIRESFARTGYYLENFCGLSGNRRFGFRRKFNLSWGGSVEYDEYPKREILPNPKKNTTYTWGVGLSYVFTKWLDFNIDWTHTKVRSNVDEDTSDDQVAFKAQQKF